MFSDSVDLGDGCSAAKQNLGKGLQISQRNAGYGGCQQGRAAAGDETQNQVTARGAAQQVGDLSGTLQTCLVGHGMTCFDNLYVAG